jgi:hypothetical protein
MEAKSVAPQMDAGPLGSGPMSWVPKPRRERTEMGVLRGLGRAVGGLLAGVFGLLRGVLQGVGSLLRRLV